MNVILVLSRASKQVAVIVAITASFLIDTAGAQTFSVA